MIKTTERKLMVLDSTIGKIRATRDEFGALNIRQDGDLISVDSSHLMEFLEDLTVLIKGEPPKDDN